MIIKDLIDIISDFNFWHKDQDTGIKREELEEVMSLMDIKDTALFILGIRRAGKTTLSKQILREKIEEVDKEQTLYINFEDNRLEPFLNKEILDNIYESYRYYINKDKFTYLVLDEIQGVEGWEKWVRTILEKKENVKIIVTGSGSRIMTPKLASILTGRKITYNLFPLAFKSFLKFVDAGEKYLTKKEQESFLKDYLKFGGFPLIALTDKAEQKTYFLQEVYEDIVIKDIMQRYHLREEAILRKTAYLMTNSFAKYVSVRKLRNSLKSIMKLNVSPSTLNYYLEYFEKSFLFVYLPIFSYNIKDAMQYPRKIYCVDSGLINAVLPKFSENFGRIYENIVCVELFRREGNNRTTELYYWKNREQYEVDFVVKQGLKINQLIQVCYEISDVDTKQREVRALLKASKELKCKDLLVITKEYESEEGIERFGIKRNVKFVPLWKWLLE